MPDQPEDLNPIAEALARLAPQPPTLSRDAMLFAAGQAAAAPRLPAWVWPSAAAFFAAVSLVLTAFLVSPGGGPGEVRYVTQYVPMTPPEDGTYRAPPGPSREPVTAKPKVADGPPDDTARMLQVRRDVIRFGVDMLPRSNATGPAVPSDVVAGDLGRWLNLPPGTFAAPPVRKTPPKGDKDDDEK
ncbi:MAG TPA: hypothetical protein VM597_22730 [Gemmataceae bacterium]|nr:hypothetical protein [Gemmataceae bacterium]